MKFILIGIVAVMYLRDCSGYFCFSHSSSFICPSGLETPTESVCNDVRDCPDGSDELDCHKRFALHLYDFALCEATEIACHSNNGTGQCISRASLCDGIHDCFHGLDEVHCSCNEHEKLCTNYCGGPNYCVPKTSNCMKPNEDYSHRYPSISRFPSTWSPTHPTTNIYSDSTQGVPNNDNDPNRIFRIDTEKKF